MLLERDPIQLNRIGLWILGCRIFCGEPASTSPENAFIGFKPQRA
jgi:hypothetical protein